MTPQVGERLNHSDPVGARRTVGEMPVRPSAPTAAGTMTDALTAIGVAVLANVPLALRGAPGSGKTSLVRAIAQKLGWPIHVMTATIQDPTDFAGLPFLSQNGTLMMHTMRAPLEWAAALARAAAAADGNGIAFFDDIAYASPGVQNALLQAVQERRIGDLQLPSGVRCVAALNPVDSASSMRPLTAPLANRMVHVTWAPEPAAWSEGFTSGWAFDLPALRAGWQVGLDATRTRIAEFIRSQPDMLDQEPRRRQDQGGPWPSGRTWEMLATLLCACDGVNANAPVRRILTAGAVGESAALAYLAWERTARLPPGVPPLEDRLVVLPQGGLPTQERA